MKNDMNVGKVFRKIIATDNMMIILYVGRNTFLFEGSLMLGPHIKQLQMTFSMIIFSWLFYGVFVLPFQQYQKVLFLISVTLFTVNVHFLLATAFTEPGIVPRSNSTLNLMSMDGEKVLNSAK
jgi:hypothetical protein